MPPFDVHDLGLIGEKTGGEYTSDHFDLQRNMVALTQFHRPIRFTETYRIWNSS